jgi:hypothetical protein
MSTILRGSRLIDNCTPSISYDRQVQAASGAFDNQCYEIIDETGQVFFIPNIMGLTDETLVDILAWQFHVDFYDRTRDLEFRKNLVQMSIQWHMTKGTVALVEWVLDTYFPAVATLQEWFEYRAPKGGPNWPPNYPASNPDVLAATFVPSNVDVTNDRLDIAGFLNQQQIRFQPADTISQKPSGGGPIGKPPQQSGDILPRPLLVGIWYYVVNVVGATFQIANTPNGTPINLMDAGQGSIQIWRIGVGSWHDRYRFRVLIDSQFIDPDDQLTVLTLIDRYKPISRWMEGFVRARASECDIGWTGMTLRFIYRTSEAPTYP